MTDKKIKVKIFRYDSNEPNSSRYDTYEVPLDPLMSLTNILDYIYDNLDRTISYNTNCRRGTCGVCTIKLDGKSVLACTTKPTQDIILDPVLKEKCIKDLVVEFL